MTGKVADFRGFDLGKIPFLARTILKELRSKHVELMRGGNFLMPFSEENALMEGVLRDIFSPGWRKRNE